MPKMPTIKEAQAAVTEALAGVTAAQKLYVEALGASQPESPAGLTVSTGLDDDLKSLFDGGLRDLALQIQSNRLLKLIAANLAASAVVAK